jgi:hypothetical protein
MPGHRSQAEVGICIQEPSVQAMAQCSNMEACLIMRVLSLAHDPTIAHHPSFLQHYALVMPALLAALPDHCRALSLQELCTATHACCLVSSLPTPRPVHLSEICAANAAAADACLVDHLIPEIKRRLRGQRGRTPMQNRHDFVAVATALGDMPAKYRHWLGGIVARWHGHPSARDFLWHMRFPDLCKIFTCMARNPDLVFNDGRKFEAAVGHLQWLVKGGPQPLAPEVACELLFAFAVVREKRSDAFALTFFRKSARFTLEKFNESLRRTLEGSLAVRSLFSSHCMQ